MRIRSLSRGSLALVFGLVACGGKDPAGESTGSTTGSDTTGQDPTTSGASMSSEPSGTSSPTSTGGLVSADTGAMTTAETTAATTDITTTTGGTTSGGTTETSAGSSTGGVECQIDQPRPGQCDGGKPKQPTPYFAGAMAPAAGGKRPGGLVDDIDEVAASTGCAFICEPDMGQPIACDIFAQDCGPGEKCSAWANDGGSSWNATKCVPVAADPDAIGEPCTVEGSGVSGVDSCAKGAMCFGVNNDNVGTCVEQCTCSEENPVCTTQNTTCSISNDGSLALCLPVCDPLDVGACGAGDVCISSGDFFICVVDASGSEGGVGTGCQFINACDPGHFCGSNPGVFADCGGQSCCTPYCDLTAPQCPQGLECTPWYEQGMAPKCFDDVGACL